MKHFFLIYTLLIIPFGLFASDYDLLKFKGIDQDVIVELNPTSAQTDAWENTKIEVTFSVPLDTSAIDEHDVKLTFLSSKTNEHIEGVITYSETDNKLTFTPSALLANGIYEVEIKSLKANKANKKTKINEIKYRFYVPETINGHQLPDELDETLNNSTLLGIDANNNGVRDDVERWILIKYKDEHPIHIDIAMQAGRAWQKVLEDPTKAKEIYPIVDAASYCEGYYRVCSDGSNANILLKNRINDKSFRKKVFDIGIREDAYFQFDKLLSGDSYTIPRCRESKKLCDFNTTKYEE